MNISQWHVVFLHSINKGDIYAEKLLQNKMINFFLYVNKIYCQICKNMEDTLPSI